MRGGEFSKAMNADNQNVWVVVVDGQRTVDLAPTTRSLAEAEATRKRKILQESLDGNQHTVEVKQLLMG